MITPTKDILRVANVYVGLRVCNSEREQGVVKRVDDLHNVYVEYDNGNIDVDFYSPLFYILQLD